MSSTSLRLHGSLFAATLTLATTVAADAVAAGGLPDLAVANVSASTTQALADQQIAVSCDVVELAGEAAGASRLKYYFSNDAVLDSSDSYLNYDNVAALSAAGFGGESANVRIPAGTPDGGYFLLFVADYDGEVSESDESNNVFALPITVGAPQAGPDYTIELASAPSSAEADEVIAVSADVVNLGLATTVETRLKYYLSSDTSYDGGDIYLNYDAVPALASGGSSPETANVRVPAGTAPGLYYLLFVADQTELVAETDEANNVVALPLSVGGYVALPDLSVSQATTDTQIVRAGETVSVNAWVDNLGTAGAPAVQLKYILSTDTVYDGGDKQLSYDKVDALLAGQTSTEDAVLNITTATAAGDYYLLLVADALEEATESNEGNNVMALALTVTRDNPDAVLADLALTGTTLAATTVPPGEAVNVSTTVENVGLVAAEASRVKYYFSSDAWLDGADTYLNYDAVGALLVGETSAEDANVTIPTTAALGPAYILVVADAAEDVVERYESDNVIALPFMVGAVVTAGPGDDPTGIKPDLRVADAWVDSVVVQAGERAALHVDVENAGVATAAASQMKYYLSRDEVFDSSDSYAGLDNVAALAVGATGAEDVAPLIPEDAAHGTWYLLAVVDAKGEVAETYESNNVTAVEIQVEIDDPSLDAADLALSGVVLSKATVGAGYPLLVDATIVNQGSQPAAASRLKLYLSDDTILDDADRYLDYGRVDALMVGGSQTLSASVRIPSDAWEGPQHVLVVLDTEREVVETYESNNLLAVPVTVGVDQGPNPAYPYSCPTSVYTDATLLPQHTVATFNALHLGWDNDKDMLATACVLSHFDLVGLVEIDDPQGLVDLENELELVTGETWSSHVSPWAVGNVNGTEFYGYVWRDAEVSLTAPRGFYPDPQDDLKREPYGAQFQMGAFDFTLVVFHLQYGDSIATRRAEASHLVDVYQHFQGLDPNEQDILIGGDFNLPGNDAAFTVVELEGVDFITDPEQKTSLGPWGLVNSFDNIFFPAAHTGEMLASGALDYTMNNCPILSDTVSDHLPVWMAFDVQSDDD
ncbi:MAG: endonuclease/exonuclease/phosphatase family protein [Myxococcales bacterium]|nr:endonuclease/exonuclease/phosphatase family protein [Myxococcales bacterium]